MENERIGELENQRIKFYGLLLISKLDGVANGYVKMMMCNGNSC